MNWYKGIKLAQYGVKGAYGFWINPNGQVISVPPGQQHNSTIIRSGWLTPGWGQEHDNSYAAAAAKNIVRVALAEGTIMFDGYTTGVELTPKQKEIIHDMFLELKISDKYGISILDNVEGVPYTRPPITTVQQLDKLIGYSITQASSIRQRKFAKRESVLIHHLNKIVDYLVNPTRQEIIGFINKIEYDNQFTEFRKAQPSIRGVFIDGDLYVWDGWGTSHCVFCKAIGKGCENLGCYDMKGSDPTKFPSDALTFMLDKEGNLITNIPQQHPEKGYFRNKLQTYEDPREGYNDKDEDFWTHKWE